MRTRVAGRPYEQREHGERGTTVRVTLAYGTAGLDIDVPDDATVIRPHHEPALADPRAALRRALRTPTGAAALRDVARRRAGRVVISVCDITRAQPRPLMVEAILDELDGIVRPASVTILIATGTHRANTPTELRAMLGERVVSDCRVINHDARNHGELMSLGTLGNGVPALLHREWVEADLRISTGFVEPHFFAGFSGGPKMVAPGLAGLDTVLRLHDARRIGHPRATWGVIDGNPVQDDIRAIVRDPRAAPHFSCDVLLDAEHQITHVFAGELFAMHERACAAARRVAMRPVPEPFDVVVTSNAGYPLDQNLYQAVKGMSAAAQVVRKGGIIICAAECRDGLPDGGSFARLLGSCPSPEALLAMIEADTDTTPDQWQVQIQARVQQHARVILKADCLTAAQIRGAHLEPTDDLREAIAAARGRHPGGSLCILPEGPQTIPYVGDPSAS
jgi:nickel-dependent lactate racemase